MQGDVNQADIEGNVCNGTHNKQSVSGDPKRTAIRTLFIELVKLNQPDWLFVLVGVVCSALIGCLFPLIAVPFSEVVRVSSVIAHLSVKRNPRKEVHVNYVLIFV